jgi:hypothetical protein
VAGDEETLKRIVDADLQDRAGVGKRFPKLCACVGFEPWQKGSKPSTLTRQVDSAAPNRH